MGWRQRETCQFEIKLIESDLHNARTEKLLESETRKERTEIVSDSPNSPDDAFVHAHVCVHCGSAFRREEFEGRALTTGIYYCPKCGVDGPLNVQICKADQVKPISRGGPEFLGIDSQRTLVALADELDYTRAAEKLSITPSELKSRIRALEELLCCSLLQSIRHELKLTEEGRVLAHFCRRFIAHAERG